MRTLWGATLRMESLGGSERRRIACLACAFAAAGKSNSKKKAAGKAIRNILRAMEECMRAFIGLILTFPWDPGPGSSKDVSGLSSRISTLDVVLLLRVYFGTFVLPCQVASRGQEV